MTTEVSVDRPSVRMWPTSRWAEHSSAQDEECQHQTADMQTKLLTHCPVSDTQTNQLAWSVLSATSVLTKVWRFLTLTCRNRAHRHSRRTLRHIAQSRTPTPATQRWPKKKLWSLCKVWANMYLLHMNTKLVINIEAGNPPSLKTQTTTHKQDRLENEMVHLKAFVRSQ